MHGSWLRESWHSLLLICVAAGWLLYAAFGAPAAPFSIDELVYWGMVDAYAQSGSLAVENGYAEYPSDALRLMWLFESSGRLVPQYPSGWAIIAAPAFASFGVRGLILINTACSVLTIVVVAVLAFQLLQDRRQALTASLLYAFATYAVDYAFGIWPHALSTLLVTMAVTATAVGWRRETWGEAVAMAVAGLCVGAAVNIRVDAALAVPAIIVWVVATYRSPVHALVMLTVGLLPGAAAAAGLNFEKFAVLSVLSYGREGPGVSAGRVSGYLSLAPFLLLLGAAALCIRLKCAQGSLTVKEGLVSIGTVLVVIGFAFPELVATAKRLLTGAYALLVDLQALQGVQKRGITSLGDGTIRIFGLPKKSLLHSMPFLAGLVLLLRFRTASGQFREIAFCALIVATWIAPFAYYSWHGGLSNNLRYFTPVLPVLSVLAAMAWHALDDVRARWRIAVGSAVFAVACALIRPHLAWQTPDYMWQNSVPHALAIVLIVLSLAIVISERFSDVNQALVSAWKGVFLAGVATAWLSAYYFDLSVSQVRRASHELAVHRFTDLPPNSLVVASAAEAAGYRLNAPPRLTAQVDFETGEIDIGLVEYAFQSGRRVFVQGRGLADRLDESGAAKDATPRYGIYPSQDLFEVFPSASSAPP